MTLKFNSVRLLRAVVKVHVPAKFHRGQCSGSWVLSEKENSDENKTVRRYRRQ